MRRKRSGAAGRLIPALLCIWVAGAAAAGLFVENLLGWLLFFSPGWANGWPNGWSFQTVLSIGMTAQILLMLLTAAAGIGAVVGFICTLLRVRWEHVGQNNRSWLWFAVVVVCLTAGIFWLVHWWVWDAFPDGYDIT